MTTGLRQALRDLADEAPVARVDEATFRHARRARRRRVVAAAVGTAAVVAGAALAVRPLTDQVPVVPADGERAGVPSRIVAVPSRLDQLGSDGSLTPPGETDLAVGRVSVCFVTEAGRTVLIGARDGRYHPMALPGARGQLDVATAMYGDLQGSVALSPDGRTLAWAWNDRPPVDRPVPAGVRLADLTTGQVRTVRLHGGEGVVAGALTWSPDSRWLAYVAHATRSWTEHSIGGVRSRVERLDSRTLERVVVPVQRPGDTVTVDDAGRVSTVNGALRRWDGRRVERLDLPAGGGVSWIGPAAPDGDVPLTAFGPGPGVVTVRGTSYELPTDDYPDGGVVRVLGWQDARHPVVSVRRGLSADTAELEGRLLVLGPHGAREVATVERAYPDTFSVATDLVRPDHLSTDFPTPDWPWSTERKVLTWGGVALGALVLLALVLLRLRVRWRRARAHPPTRGQNLRDTPQKPGRL